MMQTLDLHGLRFEEAHEAVTRFVDRLYYQEAECGRIIHGFGVIAGALPQWLAAYPFVTRWARDLHNAGSTMVWVDAAR
ncbi:MAG: Smr/MutS family protein [Deltaproteobacteria bacterium]|nr:Smr/MutS family protein [Deltaproteobacteria bacterium]